MRRFSRDSTFLKSWEKWNVSGAKTTLVTEKDATGTRPHQGAVANKGQVEAKKKKSEKVIEFGGAYTVYMILKQGVSLSI